MALAHVQDTFVWDGTSGSSKSLAYASNVTAGSLLWVFVAWGSSTATVTVADNLNGSWTAVGSPQTGAGTIGNYRCQMFYRPNAAAGATTVTATFSASISNRGLAIAEFSGADTAAPLDQFAYLSVNSSGITTPTITTTNANDVLLAGAVVQSSITAAGGGYTLMASGTGFASNATEYQIVAATGTYGPNFTEGGANDNLVAMSAFKAAAGGAPAATPLLRLLGVGS
jgi:hypothetical protein